MHYNYYVDRKIPYRPKFKIRRMKIVMDFAELAGLVEQILPWH